jgi:hypothetical protein
VAESYAIRIKGTIALTGGRAFFVPYKNVVNAGFVPAGFTEESNKVSPLLPSAC